MMVPKLAGPLRGALMPWTDVALTAPDALTAAELPAPVVPAPMVRLPVLLIAAELVAV